MSNYNNYSYPNYLQNQNINTITTQGTQGSGGAGEVEKQEGQNPTKSDVVSYADLSELLVKEGEEAFLQKLNELESSGKISNLSVVENSNKEKTVTFNMGEEKYVMTVPQQEVMSVEAININPYTYSQVNYSAQKVDNGKYSNEEIFAMGFVSNSVVNKYFDCVDGVYSLKENLVVEDSISINSIEDLQNYLGTADYDTWLDNQNFYSGNGLDSRNGIINLKNYFSMGASPINLTNDPSGFQDYTELNYNDALVMVLADYGYIKKEDINHTDSKSSQEAYENACKAYYADIANSLGKDVKDLKDSDIVRDLSEKCPRLKDELEEIYYNKQLETLIGFDNYDAYNFSESGIREALNLDYGTSIYCPDSTIINYMENLSPDKENSKLMQAIYKASGIDIATDDINTKLQKVKTFLWNSTSASSQDSWENVSGVKYNVGGSWQQLLDFLVTNNYLSDQATYTEDEINHIFTSAPNAYYDAGTDDDGNKLYKLKRGNRIYYDYNYMPSAQAEALGYATVTNAEEFVNALQSGKTIVLKNDIDMSSVEGYLSIGTTDKQYPGRIFGNDHKITNFNGEINAKDNQRLGVELAANIDKSNVINYPIGNYDEVVGNIILDNYVNNRVSNSNTKTDDTGDIKSENSGYDFIIDDNGQKVTVTEGNWLDIVKSNDKYKLSDSERQELVQKAFDKLWDESFDFTTQFSNPDTPWYKIIVSAMGGTNIKVNTDIQGASSLEFTLDGDTYRVSMRNKYFNNEDRAILTAEQVQKLKEQYNLDDNDINEIFGVYKSKNDEVLEYYMNTSLKKSEIRDIVKKYGDENGYIKNASSLSEVNDYVNYYIKQWTSTAADTTIKEKMQKKAELYGMSKGNDGLYYLDGEAYSWDIYSNDFSKVESPESEISWYVFAVKYALQNNYRFTGHSPMLWEKDGVYYEYDKDSKTFNKTNKYNL